MEQLGQCSIMKEVLTSVHVKFPKKNQYCVANFQIRKTEEAINACYDRVETLERKLKNSDESVAKNEATRNELAEVRKLLATNQKLLSTLHKHNRKTFVFGAGFVLLVFTVYMLYVLVVGPDF